MVKRKSGISAIKKFSIVGGVLILAFGGFLILFGNQEKSLTIREVIEREAGKRLDLSDQRRQQLRIQMALDDYISVHNTPPVSLDKLVPEYFDRVPTDPETGERFAYEVTNGRYALNLPNGGANKEGKSGKAVDQNLMEEDILIASLEEDDAKASFVYDPSGKRDPFRPFDFSPKVHNDNAKTPLERYDIGQLKLTAILNGFDEPMAYVEDSVHHGYSVKKGTKIGINGGEVVEIEKDRLLILETNVDFTGQTQTKTFEMRLRSKDQDNVD